MARGGARPGGGRPAKDPADKSVTRAISLPPALDAQIEARWRALGYKHRSEYYQELAAADLRKAGMIDSP